MRLSELRLALAEEFGAAYGAVLMNDLVLGELGSRTGDQALAAGVPARDVWFALCAAKDVPRARWNSAGKPAPRTGE
ncbi:DUF3046 domain-containing protein [Rathayibacter soli]|uniref:DUF3046 domain-containing protein n=1 Tax=Rathayibacter soli TaxID=3144168 RepID=UPI0027E574A7|nr:DUF3046 domain-containing protein [Glaciibacter superstes]